MGLRGLGAAGLAVALIASLSACQSGGGPADSPGPSVTSAPPTLSPSPSSPSASPSPTSPADEAAAQAVALVPIYLKAIDDLSSDPKLPLDRLHDVAVSPEFLIEATGIAKFRARGYQVTGRSALTKTTVGAVSLTNGPAASSSPRVPTVSVTACVDVSRVQVRDVSGKLVTPASRPRYLIERLTVTNRKYPDPTGWRVSHAPNKQAASCDN